MKKRRHSVRRKLILLSFAAVFGTVALCILLNEVFLVRFYEKSKQKTLGKSYQRIDRLLKVAEAEVNQNSAGSDLTEDQEQLSEESKTREQAESLKNQISIETMRGLDSICANSGLTALIVQDILSETDKRPTAIISYFYGSGGKENQDKMVVQELLGDYLYPGYNPDIRNKRKVAETKQYSVYTMYDMRVQSKYIELVGVLSNGDILLMRANVESMQESVGVANLFLVLVGLFSAVLISVIMIFVSRKFTKPIQTLSLIAKHMAELHFDVKYPVKTTDEVGELGESINELSGKLEQTISELKSANNELRMDIKIKTEAEETRKEFLSNVTHELKTPIALIQGYAEGLKDNISESPEDREFYCDVIIDEAAKMNTMVKKLLTLNHLEAGTTQIEMARFDLTELIASVLSSTEILLKQKEVTVHFTEKEPVFVWADEYMMEEVLTNYVSNAMNHISGERILEIKVSREEKHVRVAVFNTGDQIPEGDIDRIWEKFYKVDKARTREYGGNGIGLSIVKAIMEAHNQAYGVKNYDNGVEFWFELDSSTDGKSENSEK